MAGYPDLNHTERLQRNLKRLTIYFYRNKDSFQKVKNHVMSLFQLKLEQYDGYKCLLTLLHTAWKK